MASNRCVDMVGWVAFVKFEGSWSFYVGTDIH